MIRMGTLSISSKEELKPILLKNDLFDLDVSKYEDEMFIMVEKSKVTGVSIYKALDPDTAVIFLMAYSIDFINDAYRDGFFRGTVNFLHQRGFKKGIILTNQRNNEFYKTYNFDVYDEKSNLKSCSEFRDYKEAYVFTITDFFSRPCKS